MKKIVLSLVFVFSVIFLSNFVPIKAAKTPKFGAKSYTISVGESKKLKLKNAVKNKVKWITTADNDCITITKRGTITGIQAGETTVIARYEKKYYAVQIIVVDSNLTGIEEVDNGTAVLFYDNLVCPIGEDWSLFKEEQYDEYTLYGFNKETESTVYCIQVTPILEEYRAIYTDLFKDKTQIKDIADDCAQNCSFIPDKYKVEIKVNQVTKEYYIVITGKANNDSNLDINSCLVIRYIPDGYLVNYLYLTNEDNLKSRVDALTSLLLNTYVSIR